MQLAWDNVSNLLGQMRPLLIESGVPERQVKMPEGRPPEEIKIDQYAKAFDWLHRLQTSPEWEELLKVKALRPQEVWDRYKAHKMRGLREITMLEAAQLKIRKAWKNKRPGLFGRTYKPQESDDAQTQTPNTDSNQEGA